MLTVLAVIGLALAAPAVLASAHLTVLTIASVFHREPAARGGRPVGLLIVVPARNEEAVIEEALVALRRQRRPRDILVVAADRCTDRTAEIARAAGAEVIERPEDAAPGRAEAIRDAIAWASDRRWDALLMIDADSVVEPGYLDACERAISAGVEAAQTRSESVAETGFFSQTSVVAGALQGVTVTRGQEVLGCSVRLKGSGTLVRRDVIEQHPLRASGASESTMYGLELTLAGVNGHHIEGARLRFATAATLRAAGGQRLRWESGRLFLARHHLLPLLRARTRPTFEAAIYLASPPFAVAALLLGAGIALTALGGWLGVATVLAVALGMLGGDVVVALVQARVSARTWLALAAAPAYVVWKGWIQVRAFGKVQMADQAYEPTPRA